MSDTGIPVAFIDYFGRLKTRLVPVWKHNAAPRISQALAREDQSLRLELAKRFVAAKLANSAHVLGGYAKNYSDNILKIVRNKLLSLGEPLKDAKSINDVMGVEGIGAKFYWEAFGTLARCDFCEWKGRNRRPPKDPVNSLLSYAYAVIAQIILTYLELSGLDPYIGYLHSVDDRKPALALDMIEPFRALYADKLALRLLNRRQISEGDFEIDVHINNGVYMTLDARKLLVKEIYDTISSCEEDMGMESPRSAILADIDKFRTAANNRKLDEFIPYAADRENKIYKCLGLI